MLETKQGIHLLDDLDCSRRVLYLGLIEQKCLIGASQHLWCAGLKMLAFEGIQICVCMD